MADYEVESLLRRVRRRLYALALGRRFLRSFYLFAGLTLAAMLAVRGTGLWRDPFDLLSLTWPVAAALALALATIRPPALAVAARALDGRLDTKDLFLSDLLAAASLGGYQPLVREAAAERASGVVPGRMVPLSYGPGVLRVALIAAFLAALVVWLPQFDPFARDEDRRRVEGLRRQQEQMAQTVRARREELRRHDPATRHTPRVERALAELRRELDGLRPEDGPRHREQLRDAQRRVGQLWRDQAAQRLKEALERNGGRPRLGGTREQDLWRKALEQGNPQPLKDQLAALQKKLEALRKTSDPLQKKDLEREIRQALSDLKQFARQDLAAPELQQALTQALKNLDQSAAEKAMEYESLARLQEALELSGLELDKLAQDLRDLESLYEALRTLKDAQRAGDLKPLDGRQTEGLGDLAEYDKLYRKLAGACEQCGQTGAG